MKSASRRAAPGRGEIVGGSPGGATAPPMTNGRQMLCPRRLRAPTCADPFSRASAEGAARPVQHSMMRLPDDRREAYLRLATGRRPVASSTIVPSSSGEPASTVQPLAVSCPVIVSARGRRVVVIDGERAAGRLRFRSGRLLAGELREATAGRRPRSPRSPRRWRWSSALAAEPGARTAGNRVRSARGSARPVGWRGSGRCGMRQPARTTATTARPRGRTPARSASRAASYTRDAAAGTERDRRRAPARRRSCGRDPLTRSAAGRHRSLRSSAARSSRAPRRRTVDGQRSPAAWTASTAGRRTRIRISARTDHEPGPDGDGEETRNVPLHGRVDATVPKPRRGSVAAFLARADVACNAYPAKWSRRAGVGRQFCAA